VRENVSTEILDPENVSAFQKSKMSELTNVYHLPFGLTMSSLTEICIMLSASANAGIRMSESTNVLFCV